MRITQEVVVSTLTVTLSDAALARLRTRAAERDTTPEALLAAEAEAREADDPLFRLFGTVRSDATDAGERHDEHIGQALFDELRGTADAR